VPGGTAMAPATHQSAGSQSGEQAREQAELPQGSNHALPSRWPSGRATCRASASRKSSAALARQVARALAGVAEHVIRSV